MLLNFALIAGGLSFVAGDANSGWQPYPNVHTKYFLSTNTVTDWLLVQYVKSVLPDDVYNANIDSLSLTGPVSSFGPLGADGPIGTNAWDPSVWISGFMSWDDWFSNTLDGPLSEEGPLGESGPYTAEEYYQGEVFLENAFNPHTRGLSVWGILGAIGPIGAVGALGALGPVGAHGYKANANGEYENSVGETMLTYTVLYNATSNRVFDLYQNYQAVYAQSKMLDTSFMVQDDLINSPKKVSQYNFSSSQQQIVSILVVPLHENSIFDLTLSNKLGVTIATSTSKDYINFILYTAQANEAYTVTVTAARDSPTTEYRLFVTGSYTYLNLNNMVGTYIGTSLN